MKYKILTSCLSWFAIRKLQLAHGRAFNWQCGRGILTFAMKVKDDIAFITVFKKK